MSFWLYISVTQEVQKWLRYTYVLGTISSRNNVYVFKEVQIVVHRIAKTLESAGFSRTSLERGRDGALDTTLALDNGEGWEVEISFSLVHSAVLLLLNILIKKSSAGSGQSPSSPVSHRCQFQYPTSCLREYTRELHPLATLLHLPFRSIANF